MNEARAARLLRVRAAQQRSADAHAARLAGDIARQSQLSVRLSALREDYSDRTGAISAAALTAAAAQRQAIAAAIAAAAARRRAAVAALARAEAAQAAARRAKRIAERLEARAAADAVCDARRREIANSASAPVRRLLGTALAEDAEQG